MRKIALSVAVFVLFFSVVEIGVRLFSNSAPRRAASRVTAILPHPVLNHQWTPNLDLRVPFKGHDYSLRTNAQSWIETSDVPLAKPPGTFRIFMVGDSNVQGLVDFEHKTAEIIERALNDDFAADRVRIEVINTGTSSYSTLLYELLIEHVLLDYDPDLLIINIDMTDVANDVHYRKLAVMEKVEGEERIIAVLPSAQRDRNRYRMTPFGTVKISTTAQLRDWIVEHFAFVRWFDRRTRAIQRKKTPKFGRPRDKESWLSPKWSPEVQSDVDFSMEALTRALETLSRAGVASYVTGVPHQPQFTGEWSARPHQVLRETVERAGSLYLDTFAALRPLVEDHGSESFYWSWDPTHFNIEGNRVWAQIHLEFIGRHRIDLLTTAVGDRDGD